MCVADAEGAQPHRWRTGLTVALVTAVITGALAFVGVAAVVYTVVRTGITPALQQSGASPAGMPPSVSAVLTTGPAGALAVMALIVGFYSMHCSLNSQMRAMRSACQVVCLASVLMSCVERYEPTTGVSRTPLTIEVRRDVEVRPDSAPSQQRGILHGDTSLTIKKGERFWWDVFAIVDRT